ncbi:MULTISPECIES: hypothetical protein [unclassified Novosphingobium]|uniref:hypothetical protein n=1 Tax=unclassified Novosphingobium TaxID=2644732 RepID=UPI00135A0292|nr:MULTISPECIES: hypothetical protein [unclassified Novosphingobium]
MASENPSPTHERNAAIYVAVVDGATFGELAAQYGISKVRVQKTYARERTNAWEARRRGDTSYLDRPIPADV